MAYISNDSSSNFKTQLYIDDQAEVLGEVYCEQNLELRGTVKGSVYTRSFIVNELGTVFKNHIYNGQILKSDVAEYYVGLQFQDTNQKVAKWLY